MCALIDVFVLERDMRIRFRDGPRRGRGDCDAIPPLIFLKSQWLSRGMVESMVLKFLHCLGC